MPAIKDDMRKQKYLYKRRDKICIALENVPDLEFIWTDREIKQFDILWHLDMPITDLAEYFARSERSVFLLGIDRVFQGLIEPRKGWAIW